MTHMKGLDEFSNLPLTVQIVLGIALTAQLILQVSAVIFLVRLRQPRLADLSKSIWAVIIIFGQLVGATTFLVMLYRNRHTYIEEADSTTVGAHTTDPRGTVRELYGDKNE